MLQTYEKHNAGASIHHRADIIFSTMIDDGED